MRREGEAVVGIKLQNIDRFFCLISAQRGFLNNTNWFFSILDMGSFLNDMLWMVQRRIENKGFISKFGQNSAEKLILADIDGRSGHKVTPNCFDK